MNKIYDFIIVGGGTAGCVLAKRLSDKKHHVLLIEEGGKNNKLILNLPAGYSYSLKNKNYTEYYSTVNQQNINNNIIQLPRAKVIGGGSSINGLIYSRAIKNDFISWEKADTSWSWSQIFPYYKKFENNDSFLNEFHSQSGPVGISNISKSNIINKKFIEYCKKSNFNFLENLNAENPYGVGYHQLFVKNGIRSSTANSYLKDTNKKYLTILYNTLVKKIIFKNKHAYKVEVINKNIKKIFQSNNEIILSAGTFNSPKILQVSGIGPHYLLNNLGIETIMNNSNVGLNLQDHFQVRNIYKVDSNKTLNIINYNFFKKFKTLLEYIFFRSGPISESASTVGLLVNGSSNNLFGDTQFHLTLASGDDPFKLHKFSGVTICFYKCKPKSRGFLKIKSKNIKDKLFIDPNYLNHEEDLSDTYNSLKILRNILKNSNDNFFNEYWPGKEITGYDEIVDFIKNTGSTIYHQVGTCKMGNDSYSVVNKNLEVIGVTGLRVVDASIMPEITSSNTNATVLMIAEKASDMIIKKY